MAWERFDRVVLETPRLRLRYPRPSDATDYYDFCRDPRCSRYSEWLPHESVAYTKQYLRYLWRRRRWDGEIRFCLEEKDAGKVIGTCGFVTYDPDARVASLGYCIHPAYWRRGYAREAVRALLDFGFRELSLLRVEARVLPENQPSAALLEKVGFRLEGTLRKGITMKGKTWDVLMFGLTDEDDRKG